ncbi:hypothetical protein ARMSODRAFT_982620 [Armillaria solidipes]|uniref:Uncharacterized protein n=1 Tax=Armillaria solidipes TaxID=1076256 RepID=A0A2H3AMI6_9AGAR|nr:hypothetical protein ARMSODRAFT_982620 [Armillaria solidipes]
MLIKADTANDLQGRRKAMSDLTFKPIDKFNEPSRRRYSKVFVKIRNTIADGREVTTTVMRARTARMILKKAPQMEQYANLELFLQEPPPCSFLCQPSFVIHAVGRLHSTSVPGLIYFTVAATLCSSSRSRGACRTSEFINGNAYHQFVSVGLDVTEDEVVKYCVDHGSW